MTDNARTTRVVRYFKVQQHTDGTPVSGTEDLDIWIDVELMTSFIMESGAGASYRWDTWTLVWDDKGNTARTTNWKKIYKDEENDKETYVVVPVPTAAVFETGTGAGYRRFTLTFDNSDENKVRIVDIVRIYHAEFGPGGRVDVDQDDYLDVEVIKGYDESYGAGADFVYEKWLPLSGPIPMQDLLPEGQYKVREEPEEQGEPKVWPSARKIVKRGPPPIG
jgi:hypothetical protein